MRAFTPWPGSYSTFRGQTCHLWGRPGMSSPAWAHMEPGDIIAPKVEFKLMGLNVVCGEGTILEIASVQVEGRKKISAREFLNGSRFTSDGRFV